MLPVLFCACAGIAQLVEHQPSKLRVASSSLVSRSICKVSLSFLCPRNSVVEYLLGKEEVTGSSPVVGSKIADMEVIVGRAKKNCLGRHSNGKREV